MSLPPRSEKRKAGMPKTAEQCRCEALEARRLFDVSTMQVTIDSKIVEVQSTFANSIGVTFKFHDCNGTIDFVGDNLAQQSDGKRITVTGTPASLDSISLSNTTDASTISVHTAKKQVIDLPNFVSTGPMKLIDLLGTNLTDQMNILAAPKLILGNGQQANITISDAPGVPNCSIKGNSFTDTQLSTDQPISSFKVEQWVGSNASINAGVILKLTAGVVNGDITLGLTPSTAQLLKSANADTIGPGTWTVNGAVGSIKTFSTDSGWTGIFGRLDHMSVKGTASGEIDAGSMQDFKVGGDMLNMNLGLTDPFVAGTWAINSIKVTGSVINSNIDALNSVRSFTTESFNGSKLFVGLNGPTLPTETGDFTNSAELRSAKIGGRRAAQGFVNSELTAPTMGTLVIGGLTVSQSPEIVTKEIASLSVLPVIGKLFKAKHVTQESDLIVLLQPTIIIPAE